MDADCLLSTLLLFDFLNANTFYLLSNSTRPLSYPHIRSCGYLGHLKAQPHTNPNFLSFQLSYFSTLSYIKTASPLRAAFSPVCQAFSSSLSQSLSFSPSLTTFFPPNHTSLLSLNQSGHHSCSYKL